MKAPALITVSLLAVSFAACSEYNKNEASYDAGNNTAYSEGQAGNYASGNASGYNSSAAGGWPAGSRIVVENGTTYRIGPDGVRVALGPSDSRIVVENGTRFRVDPGGTRVRIDPNGMEIRTEPVEPNVTVTTNTQ